MIFFLLIFLSLYGGIHFYVFFKAKSVFHFSGKLEITVIVLLIALTLAPLVIKLVEKIHWETAARVIAYCGYLWMAFVFLFFIIGVSLDLIRQMLGVFYADSNNTASGNLLFGLAVFLSLAFVVYGFFDAQNIRVKKLEIRTQKQLPNNGRIRIVQISDVHIGLIVRGERLRSILTKVEESKPDILVSTGDLLDGELDNIMNEAQSLAAINPQYGKFAVTGNHEYYAGIEKSLEFTRTAGFNVLRDESNRQTGITIIGLEDPTGRAQGMKGRSDDLSNLFPDINSREFILLLKHQPTIREDKNFDLQLSGHTHGGQIFPFIFMTRLFFPKHTGYHPIGENKSVYISKGAGTWGPPVRLLAAPEITVIDLISDNHLLN
jgi:hypothetical protein